jgi:hypothetical protein
VRSKTLYRTLSLQPRKSPWKYRLRVSGRRFLSDLRDSHLAHSERMLHLVMVLMKTLRRRNPAAHNTS